MKITSEEVEHVAALARLELSAAEKERITEQMNRILLYMDKLNELETSGIAPMSHAIEMENVFREDVTGGSLPREECLENAPETNGTEFVVPRVI